VRDFVSLAGAGAQAADQGSRAKAHLPIPSKSLGARGVSALVSLISRLQERRRALASFMAALPFIGWTWLAALCMLLSSSAYSYTANKVWFEFLPTGIYRIYVNYTVPELKEFRESYIEFRKKSEAEACYWDLVRGADFYQPDPASRRFLKPSLKPDPW